MRRLSVFNNVTLDGFFTDRNSDLSWAHKPDEEFNEFVEQNARSGGELLFGRITYDMMASFWPTPAASQSAPVVAERMNNLPKVVFSRTLKNATWNNTRVLNGDLAVEVKKLKSEAGKDMVIFGSGTIVSQLAPTGLIDEYQLVLNPIALGKGRSMFEGITETLSLKLAKTRSFSNGNIFLRYER